MHPELETRHRIAGGWSTAYCEAGRGAPIVLVHGGGAGADGRTNFGPTLPLFAKTMRAIAVDMIGFGGTDAPDPKLFDYSQSARTRHLIDFLTAMDLRDMVLVGNSMGGTTALAVALERPDLVRALVLMGAAVNMSREDIAANRAHLSAVLEYDGTLVGQRRIIACLTHDYAPSEDLIAYRHRAAADPRLAAANVATMKWVKEHGLGFSEDQLAGLRVPTLVVAGKHDVMIPLHKQQEAMAQIPQAWGVVVPACGHWVMVEHPQTFCDLTLEFLARSAPNVERRP